MTGAEQLTLDSAAAVTAVRAGRLTAEAYVATLLARAESLRDLNTLIALDTAGALRAARGIDALRRQGAIMPPLAGLPIVVKDNINSRDLPTSGGTLALRRAQPAANAPSLQKLIDAGAIVLGKANMHELAFGMTSSNLAPFAGIVKNPYDRTRIPGGSSGGTAAAIAARIAPCGLGTDTGGSSRVPAALCGIVGLRPSVGNGGRQRRYTDTNAVVPISRTRDTVGPMGRTVVDVALLDAVITGCALPAAAQLEGLRLGLPAAFWDGMDEQLAVVMLAARRKLAAAGVVMVEVDTPGLMALDARVSSSIVAHELLEDMPAYLAATGVVGISLADIAAQVASPDVKAILGAILGGAFAGAYVAAMTVYRPQLQALYADYFATNELDAMLFPTSLLPATKIDAERGSSTVCVNGGPPQDTFAAYIRNSSPGSNAGIPGLSLPAGMTADGLPVGLELDGPLGSDRRLLGIGMAIESLLGALTPPSL